MLVLTISGSLRRGGSSTALLDAAALLAPAGMTIEPYRGLASLPAFNPDLDTGEAALLPSEVAELHQAVGRADALIISSPEYAHGVPGSLKNALDWLVGSLEFPGKPVALLTGIVARDVRSGAAARNASHHVGPTRRRCVGDDRRPAGRDGRVDRGRPSLAEPLARALGAVVAFA